MGENSRTPNQVNAFLSLKVFRVNQWVCRYFKRTTPRRIQIFKKLADIRDLGGFWGEESNKKTRFRKKCFLTLTGPLVKIGGQIDFFEVISDPH